MAGMKEKIEKKLQCLVGLPLVMAGRAATLEWFDFGKQRAITDRKGDLKTVGEFALHVQCAWRFVGPEGIIVASRDKYYPAGDPYNEPPDFNWDVSGTNRCDERARKFFQEHRERSLIVNKIVADFTGYIRIEMQGGYQLEVFPDDSLTSERWRLFRPSEEEPHFVVTGQGIEE